MLKRTITSKNKGNDVEFRYFTEQDPTLEAWRSLAAEWFGGQIRSRAPKHLTLDKFVLKYIKRKNITRDPFKFLTRKYHHVGSLVIPSFWESSTILKLSEHERLRHNNNAYNFLQWIIEDKLSVKKDNGKMIVPDEYFNPLVKRSPSKYQRQVANSETNKSSLPYCYIRELRQLLCQGPCFKDWVFAHGNSHLEDAGLNSGDWYAVDKQRIDETDPDCVWRSLDVNGREVFQMWSPVRAVALYIKLELPLRSFQVRMLDSGEADTWRYSSDGWELNQLSTARGSLKRPYQKGVFHKSGELAKGGAMTGLYINTNKTGDISKDEAQKGYVIPWQNETVLYWLEKLRDWQWKYNPIAGPTPMTELSIDHWGRVPPHVSVQEQMGTTCFLFRDATAGRASGLPIKNNSFNKHWYKLLKSLEERCAKRGETLEDGTAIQFVYNDSEKSGQYRTLFPLHSLRVSLITAYALEGGVPFQVLSKLIVGHTRLIMTLYYTKLGRVHVTEVMREAEASMLHKEQESYRRFLLEASLTELEARTSYNNPIALKMIREAGSAASLVIDEKGICPVGGCRCDEGGEKATNLRNQNAWHPVPGYPNQRNCIRCRFFITGPAFLPGLVSHFNDISYQVSECSGRYSEFEKTVCALEDQRQQAELRGELFTKASELHRSNQLHEASAEHANKLALDMQAAIRLIDQCMGVLSIDTGRDIKLVPIGGVSQLAYELNKTNSELHQLEVICENSVVYPSVDAGKATLRRSQILDSMLELNGKQPVFFRLTPEQQLLVGNEVMKLIQARSGSFSSAVEYAEGMRKLSDLGILNETMEILRVHTPGASLKTLLDSTAAQLSGMEKATT